MTDRTRRLRVVLVTGAYAPEISSGGLQSQMVARALGDRVDFQVLTTATDRALPPHQTVDGVPVSRIIVDAASRVSKLRAADEMTRELVGLLRHADIVHVQGFSQKNVLLTAIAKVLRVPVVFSLQTAGFDEPDVVARQGALSRWAFRAANLFLGVSPGLVAACKDSGIPSDRIRYVPNGVDVERFRPPLAGEAASLRRLHGIDAGRPVILFVGFFSRDKQPHVLFDAWQRLQRRPEFASTLLFVGATRSAYFEVDDRIATHVRDDAERAGLADRVVFVPPTPRVEEFYRLADAYVLPSIREGMPIALLEAMATGLPAVASRLPGSTDVLIDDGRNGVLIPPGDAAAMADAIARLLADPGLRSALGTAARQRVLERFSAERVAAAWLDAYRVVTDTAA